MCTEVANDLWQVWSNILVHLPELQTKSINIKPDSIVVFQERDLKGTPDWDHVSFSLHMDKTCLCDFLSDSQTSR